MFTVKMIDEEGRERLWSTASVDYDPIKRKVSFFPCDGLDRVTIEHGRVYVMNGEGTTVSKFPLTGKGGK
jgi:hypothetical protein